VGGAVKVKSANVLDLVRIISSDNLHLNLAEKETHAFTNYWT